LIVTRRYLHPVRPVILASASPRRKELLRSLVDEFEVVVSDVDEDALTVPDPWATAERLAEAKATAVLALRPDAVVVGGDTVVAVRNSEWEQLAKPASFEDACTMLRKLSGREHVVVTGVCVASADGVRTASETTKVRFRNLTDEEIRAYVATGEPMDKAGGYAIQGGAKGFLESVEGSLSNVIGLPVEKLREMLP
jgi:septum formation protein